MHFALQQNRHRRTVFIVDEASMIGGENYETEHNLLGDLLHYVMSGDECRLILIGDTAQLPPVGMDESPALSKKQLVEKYFLQVNETTLKEVMRQRLESGILWNATQIRDQIEANESIFPELKYAGFPDVNYITGMELEDALNSAYGKYGTDEVLVITRSNKNANLYNMKIRARIRWQENEISAGDYLMIVKNNYHWLPETSGAGFIANGDTVVIQRLGKFYEKGKFKFVDASIRFVDYPEQDDLDVKLLLNTLEGEQSNMPYHEMKELRGIIEDDYTDILLKGERMQKMRKDPFLNALQVKFAYAVTCHKSQGGQWKCVFIDQGYLTEEMLDVNYLRWLYTAVTRASEVLYFVNFIPQFFPENKN
jgi:exodeoxyribonuclease-5